MNHYFKYINTYGFLIYFKTENSNKLRSVNDLLDNFLLFDLLGIAYEKVSFYALINTRYENNCYEGMYST